jgi:hypothetical protein
MFDRASKKLGLEQALLSSRNFTDENIEENSKNNEKMDSMELEKLLREGIDLYICISIFYVLYIYIYMYYLCVYMYLSIYVLYMYIYLYVLSVYYICIYLSLSFYQSMYLSY